MITKKQVTSKRIRYEQVCLICKEVIKGFSVVNLEGNMYSHQQKHREEDKNKKDVKKQ